MQNFRTLHLAAEVYRIAKTAPLPAHLKTQLLRATSSVCLNLAEGRGRATRLDQLRHFQIALGSVRESQAVLIIEDMTSTDLWSKLDHCAASIYRLIERAR